jgi:CRP-like cAMP-binding protein
MIANVLVSWVVPVILFVLVLVAGWIGVRWAFSDDLAALRAARLFNGLSSGQLRSILRSAILVEFQPGERIVEEGRAGDAFYLVKEGTARVLVGGVEKAEVTPGGYFGEISVIDGGPRTASVIAETKVRAHQLTSQALLRAMERYPSIARLVFLKLRALLIAEGEATPYAEDAPINGDVLADLAGRLRKVNDIDWSPAGPPRRWGRRRRAGVGNA